MAIPATSWDETTPLDSTFISVARADITTLKTQVREILAVEHIMSSSGSGDTWGYHNKATLLPLSANPTPIPDSIILYQKQVSTIPELFFIDEDGHYMQLTSNGQFIGGIVGEVRMFNGLASTIPTGWEFCDGISGRPNLLSRFPKGTPNATTEPKTIGGSDSRTLTESTMPSHSITLTNSTDGSHTHTYKGQLWWSATPAWYAPGGEGTRYHTSYSTQSTNSSNNHTHSASCNSLGSGTSFDIKPSYYEAVFIVKT